MRRPKAQENPAAQNVTLIAKGNLEHEQPPIQGKSWSVVPFSRDLPEKTQSGVSKKTAPLTRHVGKRNRTGAPTLERTHRVSSKRLPNHDIKGLTPYQILGKLTSQTKKERFEVCWKEGAEMTGQQWHQQESYPFSMGRTYVRQSSAMSLRRECVHVDVFTQQDRERRCIIAASYWILRTWRFHKKFRRLVPWGFRISKGRKAMYFSVVSPLDPNTDPKYKHYLTWRTIMTDCLRWIWKQRRIRWDSIRQRTGVSCATTQFRPSSSQRSSTSKTDQKGSEKKNIKRSNCLHEEKESIRPRTAEGNLLAQHKTRDNRTWTAESNL